MSTTVKIHFNNEIRRFSLAQNASWADLRARIVELFPSFRNSSFVLSYTDEENDQITISTDEEVRDVLRTHQLVHLSITFPSSSSTSSLSPDSQVHKDQPTMEQDRVLVEDVSDEDDSDDCEEPMDFHPQPPQPAANPQSAANSQSAANPQPASSSSSFSQPQSASSFSDTPKSAEGAFPAFEQLINTWQGFVENNPELIEKTAEVIFCSSCIFYSFFFVCLFASYQLYRLTF